MSASTCAAAAIFLTLLLVVDKGRVYYTLPFMEPHRKSGRVKHADLGGPCCCNCWMDPRVGELLIEKCPHLYMKMGHRHRASAEAQRLLQYSQKRNSCYSLFTKEYWPTNFVWAQCTGTHSQFFPSRSWSTMTCGWCVSYMRTALSLERIPVR